MPPTLTKTVAVLLLALAVGLILACANDADSPPTQDSLKIGLVLNFTDSPEASRARQQAFDLAVNQLNQADGILGQPVQGFAIDATSDPEVALERVLELVDIVGIQAIVGPNASSASLPVARQISGPRQIPTISPSATSPLLSHVEDDDFFFRTALSDSAQGPVLAQVTSDQGFDNVGLIYQNDAWGRGLAETFQDAWTGQISAISVELQQDSFLPQLRESAANGPQALVVIASESVALPLVKEAVDSGLYDNFTFGDAAKRFSLIEAVGAEHLAGMYGTAGEPAPETVATQAWDSAFINEYGSLPHVPYIKETYDAVVAIALAAQAANSLEGAPIRDHLRAIGSPPGHVIQATPDNIANALQLLTFGDAAKRSSLIEAVGAEHLAGMYGTAGEPAPESEATQAWDSAFINEYGSLPHVPYIKETYDAVVAIALAAQAANSLEGAPIRDNMRAIGSPPGHVIQATPDDIANALQLLGNGEEIDYEGAAVSADWDANGDLNRGYIGVWRFTADADIEDVETVLFQY